MFSDEFIFELIRNLPFILIRLFTIVLLSMHLLFSLIIVRQTKNMSKIVEVQISPTIFLITFIHFFVSIAVLVWAILFLFVFPL